MTPKPAMFEIERLQPRGRLRAFRCAGGKLLHLRWLLPLLPECQHYI